MEKKCADKKENNPPVQTPLDKELDAAFQEFHSHYGNDFQAFLREVRESLRKQGKLSSENTESYQL